MWRRRTARFLALPWRERTSLVSFVLGFHLVAAALRFWKYQSVVAALEKTTRRAPRNPLPPDRIVDLVDMSSNAVMWHPNCLQRSVMLWWALLAAGWDSEIRFGARRRSDGSGFDFHAWVERSGEVINDDPSIGTVFIPLSTAAELPPEARLM